MPILIQPDELAARIAAGERMVILDVRWSLAEPDGTDAYRSGHIPGAVYVDLDADLADHSVARAGRHPLPEEEAFTLAMRRWGIRSGDTVVAYDDLGNQSSARAWWLLRHAGVDDVRMLDGALAAWRAAGHPLETGEVVAEGGDATARFGGMPTLDIDAAARLPGSGVLLDARAAERYRGETEPIDPRAGHIPGARSAPSGGSLDAAGRFLPVADLERRFSGIGVAQGLAVGAYCGSGVTAAHTVAALALAGIDAALYPGSWSQWSNEPARPVATGELPG